MFCILLSKLLCINIIFFIYLKVYLFIFFFFKNEQVQYLADRSLHRIQTIARAHLRFALAAHRSATCLACSWASDAAVADMMERQRPSELFGLVGSVIDGSFGMR